MRHKAQMEAGQANDKYSERVEVALSASRVVRGSIAVAAIATLVLVALLPVTLELRFLGVAWVAVSTLHAERLARRPRRLALDRSGHVAVDGVEGEIRAGSFVGPWLTVVRWRPGKARFDRTLLVAPDMAPQEELRRLRVLLRWG